VPGGVGSLSPARVLADGITQRAGVIARRSAAGRTGAACAAVLAGVLLAPPGHAEALSREFFGVSAVEPHARDFGVMGQSRVGTYRMMLLWPGVQESAKARYDWSAPDFEVASAARNGMRPFPFVFGSPPFAAGKTEAPPLRSTKAEKGWQRFLTAAVNRYGPKGKFWKRNPSVPYRPVREVQVWNEQNSQHSWSGGPEPKQYAKLVELSAAAIKRGDRRIEIVLGGMYGYPERGQSIYMAKFLKRLYRIRGIKRRFDGVAVHPYGGTLELLVAQVESARRIMDRFGDTRAPIWVSEMGWATDGPDDFPIVTTERGQAERLRGAFQILLDRRRRYLIERVIWFAWRDFEHEICPWCGAAGLIELSGDPKPALEQFKRFTAKTR
jgi:Glycosyl hydrolase catalytic core